MEFYTIGIQYNYRSDCAYVYYFAISFLCPLSFLVSLSSTTFFYVKYFLLHHLISFVGFTCSKIILVTWYVAGDYNMLLNLSQYTSDQYWLHSGKTEILPSVAPFALSFVFLLSCNYIYISYKRTNAVNLLIL